VSSIGNKGCSRSRTARFRAAQFRAVQCHAERFSTAAAGCGALAPGSGGAEMFGLSVQ